MDMNTMLPYLLVYAIAQWIVFYFLIKSAVKLAILEAMAIKNGGSPISATVTHRTTEHAHVGKKADANEIIWTPERLALYKRYESGQLTMDQYREEWAKLK